MVKKFSKHIIIFSGHIKELLVYTIQTMNFKSLIIEFRPSLVKRNISYQPAVHIKMIAGEKKRI